MLTLCMFYETISCNFQLDMYLWLLVETICIAPATPSYNIARFCMSFYYVRCPFDYRTSVHCFISNKIRHRLTFHMWPFGINVHVCFGTATVNRKVFRLPWKILISSSFSPKNECCLRFCMCWTKRNTYWMKIKNSSFWHSHMLSSSLAKLVSNNSKLCVCRNYF